MIYLHVKKIIEKKRNTNKRNKKVQKKKLKEAPMETKTEKVMEQRLLKEDNGRSRNKKAHTEAISCKNGIYTGL